LDVCATITPASNQETYQLSGCPTLVGLAIVLQSETAVNKAYSMSKKIKNQIRQIYLWAGLACAGLLAPQVQAENFNMPAPGDELIGETRYVRAKYEDTLIDIARQYSIGQDEIVMANPKVDRWLPGRDTPVLLPRQFILPATPHSGVVVNIPEMRLYYYSPSSPDQVTTYPISVGRMDWHTPLGTTKVVQKIKDPSWHPPKSIKAEHARDGEILPDVVPPGPNNPLGQYAMKLGVPGYLIHGVDVDKAYGIGMRVTHGCIRMYPEDVAKLFPEISVGTPVHLVNQPVKLGWLNNELYMEVSQALDEDVVGYDTLYRTATALIAQKTAERKVVLNMPIIQQALRKPSGIPVQISGNASNKTQAVPSTLPGSQSPEIF
jgi:L,D-transpeptidase ErfK/SrfK